MQKSFTSHAVAVLRAQFTKVFHTRNIIIMSEHNVKHIPIAGSVQFFTVIALMGLTCWAAYTTGSYVSTRATLKAQSHTLRSVAESRVNSTFGNVLQPNLLSSYNQRIVRNKYTLSDSMLSLSSPDPKMFYAHIAKLEQQVNDLKTSNETIIARVKEKTSGHIDDLESIIHQTGLNADDLKRQMASRIKSEKKRGESAEGGPYIPADLHGLNTSETRELFSDLDKLDLLRRIVANLPLGKPMTNAEQQSPFGHRFDPFTRRLAYHSGLDLAGPNGAQIYSTAAGKVVDAGRDGAYGNKIDIDHGFGIVTRYGHLSKILVTPGQQVKLGELIGIQGSTGRSTGPHLHYEVRYHDQAVNPKNFLNARYVVEN